MSESYEQDFAPPPPIWRQFTDENVKKGVTPKPPDPLTEEEYTIYGETFSVNYKLEPLSETGNTQLYDSTPGKEIEELKKLNHSLLMLFYELIDIILKSPEKFKSKISDMETVIINFSHLINSLRSKQARNFLITTMEKQVKRRQKAMKKIDEIISESKKTIKKRLEECGQESKK
ncbi:mediator of RNA polymerase ii transcription subunit [Anaeramoeba flamelloides]|uniref:Mediator of RNA polymerase II transcription subunit 7 n=1 Tax=Anaeramoeba flamelloides TaxID=1746091 RepID=A0AAV7ZHU0_9EUKA|nr:mediator of RNA polymerase ii transcription subunit [Anaeramoeba flamelloides]